MRRMIVTIGLMTAWAASGSLAEGTYVAFSLREAQRQAEEGPETESLQSLGGITRIIGMVMDNEGQDIVLVGRREKGLPAASLDDLVLALRARLVHNSWPSVDISPTADTARTGLQEVSYGGHIAQSTFGHDLLECDVILKRYSLGLLPSIDGVGSYRSLYVDRLRDRARSQGTRIVDVRWLQEPKEVAEAAMQRHRRAIRREQNCQLRFWFFPREPFHFVVRQDVFIVRQLDLMVRLQVASEAERSESTASQASGFLQTGQLFAERFNKNLQAVVANYPQLRRLKILYDMVAVAEGVRVLENRLDLTYFLDRHTVTTVRTPQDHPLVNLCGLVRYDDGNERAVSIRGGVQFAAELKWLNEGDITPLRDIVLDTRPGPGSLVWPVPLETWNAPNCQDLPTAVATRTQPPSDRMTPFNTTPGHLLVAQEYLLGPEQVARRSITRAFTGFAGLVPGPPMANPLPAIDFSTDTQGAAPGLSVRTTDLGGVYIDASGKTIELASVPTLLENLHLAVLRERPSRESIHWDILLPEEALDDD